MRNNNFIKNSIKIHGNKYDYSRVEYLNAKTDVKIICPIHGEFEQTPTNHSSGKGCTKCGNIKRGNSRRSSNDDFIKKSIKIHDDKYDYSKVEYLNNSTKVIIICKKHGEFKQSPCSHLNGSGCTKCYLETKKRTNFKEISSKIHNDKYDYSYSEYIDLKTKVKIICPLHGEFEQTPQIHIIGHGCPKCAGNNKLTKEDFIRRSNLLHNDKYDYSKVELKNSKTKVIIVCPKHGEFKQEATTHYIKGCGCPSCKRSNGENKIKECLEKLKIRFEQQKIFKECKNIKSLPFDFYLPDLNTCIEFDGKQHFIMDGYINKNKEELDVRQKCDKIKTKFCLENKIKLIRIPYNKENKIESIINNI
jgi:very-short-patch-repair endonuclease